MRYRVSMTMGSATSLALVAALRAAWATPGAFDTNASYAWRVERRGTIEFSRQSLVTEGKLALWEGQEFGDFELRCQARIAEGVRDGAVWVRFRYRSDNEHYALALQGWPCNDLFLFRFGPGEGTGCWRRSPLGFEPLAGRWYDLRIECAHGAIAVYLSQEREPRFVATDESPLGAGLVGVGGGYRKAEYTDLVVERTSAPSTLAKGAGEPRRPARGTSRSQYRPIALPRAVIGRQTVPLDGTWLFLPDQEREPGMDPRDRKVGDGTWHGLDVPQFWTPTWWWIYGRARGRPTGRSSGREPG